MTEFSKKVAVVTGGGSGIGKALVEQRIGLGATVVFADIDPERIKAIIASIGLRVDRIKGVTCDVTDFEQVYLFS
jgi:NAD(P)-dependent dehydrogenase (short-subunit alcohol dehydrogenase family)